MRKCLSLFSALFLLVSCYEEVLIPVGEGEPVPVMNAQFNNLEPVHVVSLSLSRLSSLTPLEGAEVQVYVNGSWRADAVEEEPSYHAARYAFEASWEAGDEIQIVARKGSYSVSAVTTVPYPVEIEAVDTASAQMSVWGEMEDYVQMKVRFHDLPGPSWYGINARCSESCDYLDGEGLPIPGYSVADMDWAIPLETGFDPIVSEGSTLSGGDWTSFFAVEDEYHVFSDVPFSGQDCSIRVLADTWSFFLPDKNYGIYYPEGMMDEDYGELSQYPRRVRRRCILCLRSLGLAQYHYLKALSNLEAFGTDVSFLIEPTTLPSNVEGGIGFVGVEMVSEIDVAVFEKEYSPLDNLYYN